MFRALGLCCASKKLKSLNVWDNGKDGLGFLQYHPPLSSHEVKMELCVPYTCRVCSPTDCCRYLTLGLTLCYVLIGEISITETCSSVMLMSLSDLFKKPTIKALPFTTLFCFCILVCFLLPNLTVYWLRFVKACRQWKNIVRMRYLLKILLRFKYLSSVKHMALKTYFETR